MLIYNSKKFIFVHIQKCAGSSITEALDPFLQWNDIQIGVAAYGKGIQNHYHQKFNLRKHSKAKEIKKIVGDSIWNEYFVFSSVRHPCSRAVSLYTWINKSIRNCKNKNADIWKWRVTKAALATNSFTDFIRHQDFVEPSQFSYLSDQKKSIIVDYICRHESLKEDFSYVCKHLGINNIDIPEVNTSNINKENYIDYYKSQDDIDVIVKKWKDDFEQLEYEIPVLL